MAKKVKDEGRLTNEVSGKYEISEVRTDIANPATGVPVYFERVMWKGIREVFKCAKCGTFRDDKDAMIEHVLLHYSFDERERMLEILLKEK